MPGGEKAAGKEYEMSVNLTLSVIDASLLRSIWGNEPLKRDRVKVALEIDEAFENVVLGPHRPALTSDNPEERKALLDVSVTVSVSPAALGDLAEAWDQALRKMTFPRNQVRQVARISDALREAKEK